MRVLVTGGSGFIGSHVVDKLRARGHTPVIYDLRPVAVAPGPRPPGRHRPGVDHRPRGARARPALLRRRGPPGRGGRRQRRPRLARGRRARQRARHGRRSWRRRGARGSSGSSTPRRSGSTPTASPRRSTRTRCCPRPATSTPAPSSPGELYCKAYQELYGIDYTILRFGIPYGPRAREAAVIPAFVNKALAGRSADARRRREPVPQVRLRRGPRRRRRPRRSDDVAVNRVYNLASDETVTIKQIAETIKELMGDVEIVHTPARPGDFGGKIVSCERALEELGWTAATPFSEGVRQYIDWRLSPGRGDQGGGGGGGHPGRRARRRGQAAPGADHLRRHRRGPRPPRPRGRP